MSKKLQPGESYGNYINRRIEEIFNDLAKEAGEQVFAEYGEDAPAGALAFSLMAKSILLQQAWKEILQ